LSVPEADIPQNQTGRPGEIPEYPWHDPLWATLTRELNRLPHALLLQGQPGLGKHAFALRLARALLCAELRTPARACGACKSCQLFSAGNHPDLFRVEPLEEGRVIAVDQVRAITEFLSLRPHTAARKVVVLSPAESMNVYASNSLLKILEEPPAGSLVLLVSNRPAYLPATIRSRCTRISFMPPPVAEGQAWLEPRAGKAASRETLRWTGGAPLAALELVESGFIAEREQLMQDVEMLPARRETPSTCAARWKTYGTARCLAWFHGLISDFIRVLLVPAGAEDLANPEVSSRFLELIKMCNIKELYKLLDVICESRRALQAPLDEQLVLEEILIRWCKMAR
jgi:DNA polymerase-3 subunit delta'